MKKLFSIVALASMVLLSINAHSKLAVNKLATNGVSLNGVSLNIDQTLNLRGLAQAPLVKAD
ncbi:MAG: hypothetical protein RKP20_11295 [Candidatus Competibacter sp.]|nr:hypothetical protein [Candidatus Competibacter sp.]